MSQDWQIQARSLVCQGTGRPFQDGESYWSALRYVAGEGYVREDFCAAYWESEAAARTWISAWRGIYLSAAVKPAPTLTREAIEDLLREQIEQGGPECVNAIYLLAVMLERKRILVERTVRRAPDGVKIRVYEHKKSGETFLVTDPALRLDELEAARGEVLALLAEHEAVVRAVADAPAPEPAQADAESGEPVAAAETSGADSAAATV